MHAALENLFARRSIRQFKDRDVPDELVKTILEAAMAAPSAGNYRPVDYVVVRDAETRHKLADIHPYAKMVPQAPVCIIPCGLPARSFASQPDFWIQDAAAATENMLLAAVALGLGAVWCGVYPVSERVQATRELLGLPAEVVPFALVPLGYPAEHKEPRTQYDDGRVHHNRW